MCPPPHMPTDPDSKGEKKNFSTRQDNCSYYGICGTNVFLLVHLFPFPK